MLLQRVLANEKPMISHMASCFLIIYSIFPITLSQGKQFRQSRSLSAFVMIPTTAKYHTKQHRTLWICFYWICCKGPMDTAAFFSWKVLSRSAFHLQLYFLHSFGVCGQWKQWGGTKQGPSHLHGAAVAVFYNRMDSFPLHIRTARLPLENWPLLTNA